jgi:hypothetical protein
MKPIAVVPAYNEAPTVGAIVAAARRLTPVVVIDDGSVDATAAVARAAGADVVRHARRLGKGQALRTGFAAARVRGATHVVTIDGDGQHDPRDLPVLLDTMRARPYALVIGRRTRGGGLPRGRANANRVAGFFAGWAGGTVVSDSQSGFRIYPIAMLDALRPQAGGFVFETAVLLDAVRHGWDVVEVDVAVIPQAARRSRFRPLADGGAIGAFLARRVIARWGLELGAAAREATSFARGDVRRARHAAILAEMSRYADEPSQWLLGLGVTVAHRISDCLGGWWVHPRLRRAGVAAAATAATPVLAAAAIVQTVVPPRVVDLVTPLVDRLYAPERLGTASRPIAPAVARRTAASPDEGLVAAPPRDA